MKNIFARSTGSCRGASAFNDLLLHDALVWSIAREGNKLIMVLRKDIPPRNLVILTYTLCEEPHINPDALSPEQRMRVMDFQYDEFDVVRHGDSLTFSQSIMFGNGWEMTLRFSDVEVTQAEPLYPFPRTMLLVPVSEAG